MSRVKPSATWLLGNRFTQPRHDWLKVAQGEHSSVSAFAELSLQLSELGCPPDLLAATHNAALDEIKHAQTAFTLEASAQAATAYGPAEKFGFSGQIGHLWRLHKMVMRTFEDGCIFEAVSAYQLKLRAEEEQDPRIKQEILMMLTDENRHVELAWQILDWCFKQLDYDQRATLFRRLWRILDKGSAKPQKDAERVYVEVEKRLRLIQESLCDSTQKAA